MKTNLPWPLFLTFVYRINILLQPFSFQTIKESPDDNVAFLNPT